MRRRRLLALLGVVGAAGCAGTSPTRSSDATPEDAETLTPAPVPDTPGVPGVPDAAPGDCPDFGPETRVVCTDAAPDGAMAMDASTTRPSLPAAVTFSLHNRTARPFRTNFHAWRLYKRVAGRWYRVAPTRWPQPLMTLPPEVHHAWTAALSGDAHAGEPVPRATGSESIAVDALGGGTYAFGVDGRFGDASGARVAFVTTFNLDGPPLSLTASERLATETVTVTDDRVTAALRPVAGRDGTPAVYRLRPAPDAADARRLVPEQVMRPSTGDDPLRDALSLAADHPRRTVELRGPTGCHPPFCVEDSDTVAYEGTTYRVTSATLG